MKYIFLNKSIDSSIGAHDLELVFIQKVINCGFTAPGLKSGVRNDLDK